MKDVCCMKLGREAASGKGELVIVPTAIVYTNKSSYRSLLCIFSSFLSIFWQRFWHSSWCDIPNPYIYYSIFPRGKLSRSSEDHYYPHRERLSINVHDWNTLYAARLYYLKMRRVWGCRTLSSRRMYSGLFRGADPRAHFLLYRLINTFNTKLNSPAYLPMLKLSPIKYYSLLHHTSTTHTSPRLHPSFTRAPFFFSPFYYSSYQRMCLGPLHDGSSLWKERRINSV